MLREWLINDFIFSPLKLGSPIVDGLFLDDFWCANAVNGSGACRDPVQGPTEIDANNQADMGLSDADVADLTRAWLETFTAVQAAVVARGKYTWSLIPGQDNADASPRIVTAATCARELAAACAPSSPWLRAPLLHGLALGADGRPSALAADVAAFQLMRGPWAWTGAGVWGMSWPMGATWNSSSGAVVPRPPALDADYGAPLDATCARVAPGGSVFSRRYEKSTLTLDCATMAATGVLGL